MFSKIYWKEGISKMKNKWFLGFGVLLVFGLFLMACPNDDGGDSDPFAGSWTGQPDPSVTAKFVAANGSFKQYINDVEGVRGTYTFSGNNVTIKVTEVNPGVIFSGTNGWVTYANLSEEYKGYLGGSDTRQITISGKNFTAEGTTFTKQ
jgi:hypothetical protein